MFGFHRATEVDENKVTAFVYWFLAQGDRIASSVENSANDRNTMMAVLDEVEDQLSLVYRDGYKGQIEFDYGGKGNEWELNLYHKGNPFLVKATEKIAASINSRHDPRWKANTYR